MDINKTANSMAKISVILLAETLIVFGLLLSFTPVILEALM